jgi:hypothetical protein
VAETNVSNITTICRLTPTRSPTFAHSSRSGLDAQSGRLRLAVALVEIRAVNLDQLSSSLLIARMKRDVRLI